MMARTIVGEATFSPDGVYRYTLTRRWAPGFLLTFVGLNPSTADATTDDPTIRRCMDFAEREGAAGILMLNLFAYRATTPARLKEVADPFGPQNWRTRLEIFAGSQESGARIVCAWGAGGNLRRAGDIFMAQAHRAQARLICLGMTKGGQPRHPLYLAADTPFEPFA